MRSIPLLISLFALMLVLGCPKGGSDTSGSVEPEETPEPEPAPFPVEPSEAAAASNDAGAPANAAQRLLQAVILRAEGSEAEPPTGLSLLGGEDGLLLVQGNPRLLPTRGDWTTAAVLGDDSAAAKVTDLPELMATLAAGTDPLTATVTLSDEAPDDAQAQLEALRITVDSASDGSLDVQVLASKLDKLLGVVWVQSLEPGTNG